MCPRTERARRSKEDSAASRVGASTITKPSRRLCPGPSSQVNSAILGVPHDGVASKPCTQVAPLLGQVPTSARLCLSTSSLLRRLGGLAWLQAFPVTVARDARAKPRRTWRRDWLTLVTWSSTRAAGSTGGQAVTVRSSRSASLTERTTLSGRQSTVTWGAKDRKSFPSTNRTPLTVSPEPTGGKLTLRS